MEKTGALIQGKCPIQYTLSLLGDKWTLLILRDLLFYKKKRYQDFLASEEGISTNILAERLKKLAENNLIIKTKDPENKKQFFYKPTQACLDLLPLMVEVTKWGLSYAEHIDPQIEETLRTFVISDPELFIRKMQERFKED